MIAGLRTPRRIALAIVLGYFLLQLAGLKSAALTDDDDFYLPAGISYAEWLGKLFGPGVALDRQAIDAAFQPNKEHPPLAKYVFGVMHFLLRDVLGPYDSARVGTVLFSTLIALALLWMAISHLGGRRGLRVGGLAVLALITLPRFFFHSHAATLDVPVAAMITVTTAVLLRAERSTKWAIAAGPIFGLALATKLNAPFLLIAYLAFILLTRPLPERSSGEHGLRAPPLPLALVSLLVLGPVVFFLSWPWLWFDSTQRIGEYIGFHLHHYGILFLYFGRVYSADPFAPWHAPFVMALSTTPIATLVLGGTGVVAALRPVVRRLAERRGPDGDPRREGDLLLIALLSLIVHIAVVAFAGTPIYGGEKLFSPFFPFLCLFAGYGGDWLYRQLTAKVSPRIATAVVSIAAGSGLALLLRFGPYALSEYNGLIGGLRGATAAGFERQYYDLAFRDLAAWLSTNGPPKLKVHFLPNNWEYVRTYRWYQRGGLIRSDLEVVASETDAQWIVITHERRFSRYGDDLARYRGAKVIAEQRVDGVPIWTVVERR